MRKLLFVLGVLGVAVTASALTAQTVLAGDLGWLDFGCLFHKTPLDVHRPEACNQCGHEGCIERCPVEDCATGEKKVYKPSVHCQYVAIPEVRYRWEMKCITKEIPCEYCKPVCKSQECDHCYESEHWDRYAAGCAEVHCKTCQPNNEKLECKRCECEPGKTTVKVHYWSCVKVPYTVYRQVPKEVCVKQPRCEKVEVPVTRYVCQNCGLCKFCSGRGCEHCQRQAGDPGAPGCADYGEQSISPAPSQAGPRDTVTPAPQPITPPQP